MAEVDTTRNPPHEHRHHHTTRTTSNITPDAVQGSNSRESVLTYKQSFVQWLKSPSHEEAERRVLEQLNFFPESDGKRVAKINKVDISNKRYINEFEIINIEKDDNNSNDNTPYSKNLVVLHGYGAGMAFFYRNFEKWSSIKGSRTFSLDLLGFGRSSRPRFHIPTKDMTVKDENGRVKAVVETENWFIDSLEEWRIAKKLEKFTLMGHSMGGYLAAAYAFKYPSRVERLIMVSPAGVERGYTTDLEYTPLFSKKTTSSPSASSPASPSLSSTHSSSRSSSHSASQSASHPIPITSRSSSPSFDESTPLTEEITLPQSTITHEHNIHPVRSNSSQASASSSLLTNEASTSKRNLPSWAIFLWNRHLSPFVVLRFTGGFAPRLVSFWSSRRFNDLTIAEQAALHMYSYKTFTAPGSGEYGLTRLLAVGAVAREPLVDRVVRGIQCPTVWIYGENDWMNIEAGKEAVLRLNRLSRRPDARNAKLHVVEYAGHHVYLDNPPDFDKLILNFLKNTNA